MTVPAASAPDSTHAALAQLLACAGLPTNTVPSQPVIAHDPLLPCGSRITAAATAVHQALGLLLRELQGAGGSAPPTVDPGHATAWLRSYRYFSVQGAEAASPFDPLTGFYRARDGRHVYCHCNFPHHARGLALLLGVAAERAAVARAIATWTAADLEGEMAGRGLCGGVVRTVQEWQGHSQSLAALSLPLFELRQIAEGPAMAPPGGGDAPAGLRVLDLTRVLAGPTCTRLLADQGADVLRITAPHLPDSGFLDWDTGVGKRNAFIDLRQPAGRRDLWHLVETADVFCQAYRPGTIAARGFDQAALAAARPGIVCASLSAYGGVGPWADRRGYDTLVQAVTGLALSDSEDGLPRLMPVQALDYLAGGILAVAICAALRRRSQEGGTWAVSTSLARVTRWLTDMGQVPRDDWTRASQEFTADQLAPWTMELHGPLGRTRHLRSPLQAVHLPGPPNRLGANAAQWSLPAQAS